MQMLDMTSPHITATGPTNGNTSESDADSAIHEFKMANACACDCPSRELALEGLCMAELGQPEAVIIDDTLTFIMQA